MTDQSPAKSSTDTLKQVAHQAVDHSIILQLLRQIPNALSESRLGTTASWLGSSTRQSFLYLWLTKEPEPEVIVINLRETWTVGPIIVLLDRGMDRLAPYWQASMLKRLFDWIAFKLESAATSSTGQRIIRLLEPPEPPERSDAKEDK